jgi:2-C-methyl-D-erythritol 4-phosphate cytidylyltransferase
MIDKSKGKFTVITAGGIGSRMGLSVPKQFSELGNMPVLMHSIMRFREYDSDMKIVLSLPKDAFPDWVKLCRFHNFEAPYKTVKGGRTRFHSVRNALAEVPRNTLVAVHDGVRPLVAQQTIANAFAAAAEQGAAVPVFDIPFSLRKLEKGESRTVHREKYKEVQTPQVFKSELLKSAYEANYSENFTDDASVVEAAGHTIFLTQGNRENIKITYPSDLIIAEALLNHSQERI